MKQLKSDFRDIRRMFERAVPIREIAEPLVSFDASHSASDVRTYMEDRHFDRVGAREKGVVVGCVRRDDLKEGRIGDHIEPFADGDVLDDGEPIRQAIEALRNRDAVFVRVFGEVGGIVTRGDLQKAPVRMMLFGLVSLIEMQVLRLIRERFPRDGWVDCITKGELAAARKLFRELRAKNEEIDLGDCLPLRCKARILLSDPGLRRSAGFGSKEAGQDFFDELGRLRNRLAHAQDIITGRWPRLAVFAKEAGEVLERLESTSGGL